VQPRCQNGSKWSQFWFLDSPGRTGANRVGQSISFASREGTGNACSFPPTQSSRCLSKVASTFLPLPEGAAAPDACGHQNIFNLPSTRCSPKMFMREGLDGRMRKALT